ncbi:MAG: hypothetical protein IJ960_03380, partial [Oscillospiraceae bacterium]|nr:hypothetical protein [Oscillospiraceae bacterium]
CFDDIVGDGLNQCVIATGNHQDSDSLRGAPPRRPDPKSDLDGRILGNCGGGIRRQSEIAERVVEDADPYDGLFHAPLQTAI